MKKILILEDEPFVAALLRLLLKGYIVVEATTAAQALQAFTEHNRQFDLLIADVNLPISSGVQVAVILRSQLPTLKVILSSGYPLGNWREQDVADLQRLGEHSVTLIEKPFLPKALTDLVHALIGPAKKPKPVKHRAVAASQG
jgi:CheY-like chemotaxis protein